MQNSMRYLIQLSLIAILAIGMANKGVANIHYHTKNGIYTFEGKKGMIMDFPKFYTAFDKERLVKHAQEFQDSLATAYQYHWHANYAVNLLKLGKTALALSIFKELVKYNPDDFVICTNLGIAYELIGEPDAALLYIQQAYSNKSELQNGTEWIHINILKAKIALQGDPAWFDAHTILDPDGSAKLFEPKKAKSREWDKLLSQIKTYAFIQGITRGPFSKPPNEIFCQLILEMGDIYAENFSLEKAYSIYATAQVFQTEKQEQKVAQRLIETERLLQNNGLQAKKEILLAPEPKGNHLIKIDEISFPSYIDQLQQYRKELQKAAAEEEARVQATILEEQRAQQLKWGIVIVMLLLGAYLFVRKYQKK